MDKSKNNSAPNLLKVAEKMLVQLADEGLQEAVFGICKLQLAVYKSFIELGCNPQQAHKHTRTYMEAVTRSAMIG